jgi:hypothetical protein
MSGVLVPGHIETRILKSAHLCCMNFRRGS